MNIITLLAAKASDAQQIRQDWSAYVDAPTGNVPDGVIYALRPKDVQARGYNKLLIAATNWGIWRVVWPDMAHGLTAQENLDWFLAKYPQVKVARAWSQLDGAQLGTTKVIDPDTGAVSYTGTPTYKEITKAKLIKAYKDIRRYAADGSPLPSIKRTIANLNEQVTRFAGDPDLDFSQ